MTTEDFLAFVDAHPNEKWELIEGRPEARAVSTIRHAILCANVSEGLEPHVRAKGCRALRDTFLRIAANDGGMIFDPDVMIRCGPIADQLSRIIEDATAVFEVLSPSTMYRDRGVKLEAYMATASMRQIVLIYAGKVRVESWTRDADGRWPEEPRVLKALAESLFVPAAGIELSLQAVYDGVDAAG